MVVTREVFREVPPRVEYSATELGLSLEPVLLSLCNWGSDMPESRNGLGSDASWQLETKPLEASARA
jgi:DNA-binding HxlR family transcriptional regulator